MKARYFCSYHAERMKACESEAYRQWLEMMKRGMQAYVACRMDAAQLYLGTALEIALLRQACTQNGIFGSLHILKPSQFLVELFTVDRQWSEVSELVEKIARVAKQFDDVKRIDAVKEGREFNNFIESARQRLAGSERALTSLSQKPGCVRVASNALH